MINYYDAVLITIPLILLSGIGLSLVFGLISIVMSGVVGLAIMTHCMFIKNPVDTNDEVKSGIKEQAVEETL